MTQMHYEGMINQNTAPNVYLQRRWLELRGFQSSLEVLGETKKIRWFEVLLNMFGKISVTATESENVYRALKL